MKIDINKFRYYNCDDCTACRNCHLPQDLQGCAHWREHIKNKLKIYEGQSNWGIAYTPSRVFENKIRRIIFDWANDGEVLVEVIDKNDDCAAWVLPIEEYWAWMNFQCKESAEMVLRCCNDK